MLDLRQLRKSIKRLVAPPAKPNLRSLVPEADDEAVRLIERVTPYTMTSPERLWSFLSAVRHVTTAGVSGDIVECGVWRGGNLMIAAALLEAEGDDRMLYG